MGHRFLLPINTGRVDWRAFPLAELTGHPLVTRQLGPSTRVVETGLNPGWPGRMAMCVCCAAVMLQEKPSASETYEHVRDDGSEHDAQTMDAATESQRQMMQMTDVDDVNNADDDAAKPDVPQELEKDISQVISMY